MVGLFSENPLLGYCQSTPLYQSFNIDFLLSEPIIAHKYVLQSMYNIPHTGCNWAYPVSWKIYYGENFSDLTLFASETDNTILSKRAVSFEFNIQPFRASVIRLQIEKACDTVNYFGLSQFDIYGEIESIKNCFQRSLCMQNRYHMGLILNVFIIITSSY